MNTVKSIVSFVSDTAKAAYSSLQNANPVTVFLVMLAIIVLQMFA